MKSIVLLALCVSLFAAHSARAASAARGAARIAISKHVGTEACMNENALRRAVEVRLRRSVFRGDLPVTLDVQVVFERAASGWSAELTMRDGSGQLLGRRSIMTEAAHCSALDDSLALVVALLVDAPPSVPVADADQSTAPVAATTHSEPEPAPAAAPLANSKSLAPPPMPSTAISLPRDTLAPREPWRVNVSLAAVAALGVVPGLAPGVEFGLGAQPPRAPELRLFVAGFARRDQTRADSRSGAHFDLASAGLEVCALDVHLGALGWFGCAGQSLGRLRVASFGFDQNTTSEHLTYALLARTGFSFPLFGHVAARVGARAELPLERAIFEYGSRDGSERSLYEMKPITAALDLGLIVRL